MNKKLKCLFILGIFACSVSLTSCEIDLSNLFNNTTTTSQDTTTSGNSDNTSSSDDNTSTSEHNEHTFSDDWEYNNRSHWHPALCCDAVSDYEGHDFVYDQVEATYESGGYITATCNVCGYSYTYGETSQLYLTVTWLDDDGSILKIDDQVVYGSMPSYGEDPIKEPYAQYAYTFTGWYPEVSYITTDMTYTATYSVEDIGLEYTLNEDNESYSITSLKTDELAIIVIPSTYNGLPITSIASGIFRGNTTLKEIIFEDDCYITSIDDYMFYGCSSLTYINIPNSITSIGDYAFYGCSLDYIYIPSSVETIGYNILGYTSRYEIVIYCEASSKPDDWDELWYSNTTYDTLPIYWNCLSLISDDSGLEYIIINDDDKYAIIRAYSGSSRSVVVPESIKYNNEDIPITSIGIRAFYNLSISSITIPNSVTSISSYAFYACHSLTSITIPDSVISIGDYAFYYCYYLRTITFGENSQLTTIGDYAFYDCSFLNSITIPSGVTSIGDRVFYRCSGLTTVQINEDSQLTSIGSLAFYSCISLTSIYIPSGVMTIGAYAFSGCTSLTIYCEAESQPDGWDTNYKASDCPVIWGVTYEEYLAYISQE